MPSALSMRRSDSRPIQPKANHFLQKLIALGISVKRTIRHHRPMGGVRFVTVLEVVEHDLTEVPDAPAGEGISPAICPQQNGLPERSRVYLSPNHTRARILRRASIGQARDRLGGTRQNMQCGGHDLRLRYTILYHFRPILSNLFKLLASNYPPRIQPRLHCQTA